MPSSVVVTVGSSSTREKHVAVPHGYECPTVVSGPSTRGDAQTFSLDELGSQCPASHPVYEPHTEADHGDVCRSENGQGGLKCPNGCSQEMSRPHCRRGLEVCRAKSNLLMSGPNKKPPPGYVAKPSSGPCRCRGAKTGLDSCGELCCDNSPFTDVNPTGRYYFKNGGTQTKENLCFELASANWENNSSGSGQEQFLINFYKSTKGANYWTVKRVDRTTFAPSREKDFSWLTPTLQPSLAPSQSLLTRRCPTCCEDRMSSCTQYTKITSAKNPQYLQCSPYTRKYCPGTCGTCHVVGCIDEDPYCGVNKETWCSNHMRQYCPMTCGLCKSTGAIHTLREGFHDRWHISVHVGRLT